MKMKSQRAALLLALAALLLTVSVSGTLAYLMDRTETVTNTFVPKVVEVDVRETFKNSVKESIQVFVGDGKTTDSKTTDAFVRVAVVGYWVNADGAVVASWDSDGFDEYLNTTAWVKVGNYYYHTSKVNNNSTTNDLLADGKDFKAPTKPDGLDESAYFVLNILAQGVQSEPHTAAMEAWPEISIDTNGTLSAKK